MNNNDNSNNATTNKDDNSNYDYNDDTNNFKWHNGCIIHRFDGQPARFHP